MKNKLNLYTFENFIVDSSNLFSYKALQSIINGFVNYNPFVLYGTTATGKTHLLKASRSFLKKNGKNVIYINSTQFINDITKHSKKQTLSEFKNKYYSVDILLIDDIQFFNGNYNVQNEFTSILKNMLANNKNIIITSNIHPANLVLFTDELKSFLLSGLKIKISKPSLKAKYKIAKSKAKLLGIKLNKQVYKLIAKKSNCIRQIEGNILLLKMTASMSDNKVSCKMAKNILKENGTF